MGLGKFITAFSHLRTYKDRRKFSINRYHASHKPFLLFSFIDLVAQGLIKKTS